MSPSTEDIASVHLFNLRHSAGSIVQLADRGGSRWATLLVVTGDAVLIGGHTPAVPVVVLGEHELLPAEQLRDASELVPLENVKDVDITLVDAGTWDILQRERDRPAWEVSSLVELFSSPSPFSEG